MLTPISVALVAVVLASTGVSGLPSIPGLGNLKKFKKKAAPTDSIPPVWKPSSRLALEDRFVWATLPPLTSGPASLKFSYDPRRLRVGMDPASGMVSAGAELSGVQLGDPASIPLSLYATDLSRRNFERLWAERSRQALQLAEGGTPTAIQRSGLSFELPSPLPKRIQSLLGPGGPSLNVSGSENIKLSGQSEWTNQTVGLLGQRRSLFPSLDMQQDLDIRLEGRLSDRVGVNLLQNSANQIPLANRIAINYRGDEDDLVQALDLGNTNLALPGTQYVSYSGKNEGLFGMKATARLGPLDVTLLASKQQGRSERASYAGGSSSQTQTLGDLDYVKGVYYLLYDPSVGNTGLDVRAIADNTIRVYFDEGVYGSQINVVRGRAFVDPNTAVFDSSGIEVTTPSVRGTFKLLTQGAEQDYEVLNNVYGPLFKVIRLRRPITGENQRLAVTYSYQNVAQGPNGELVPVGDSIAVGGDTRPDTDGIPALTMKLLRAPLSEMPADPAGNFDPTAPFFAVRELELKNFYQLGGQRIDPRTIEMAIRKGDDNPPRTTLQVRGEPVPYIELLGLDNYDESSGFISYDQYGHDGRVDGTAPTSNFRVSIDFENGTLFFMDPRPFAPRLSTDATGRAFDRFISTLAFRRDSLVGPPDSANAANPSIYERRVVLRTDREYSIDLKFTAARAGGEINLGRTNIIEGSDVVTINGVALARDRDYQIDYDLGRVKLIRQLGATDQLNIDYSYAPLFQQAGRTLIGNAFRWEGRDRSIGGAFMYESKGADDLRPRLGEEPSRVVIGDLNGEWRMRPEWITRAVDRLPGVRTTAPSEFNVTAEIGASFPNPNTNNEVYIDDMEGVRDAVSLSMAPDRWRWTSVPAGLDTANIRNAELHWYTPLNVVKERDLKPSLSNAQGAQNSRTVLAMSIPRRPASAVSATQPLWAGLTYPLDPVGLDLSRSQFIDLWVNDFADFYSAGAPLGRVRGRGVKLHIDLGVVAEDQMRAPDAPPNSKVDSEDLVPRDNQLVVTDELNEDTGLDNLLSPDSSVVRDLTTASAEDPEGDDFSNPDETYEDFDPRKWRFTNGTEDNKTAYPVPDTEDFNLNGALDRNQSYFGYTIDLGDTASPYLVTDVLESFTHYANDGAPVPADNGWRRYRIPITDSLRVRVGSPDLTLARHVRIWLEGIVETDPPPLSDTDGRPYVMVGGVDIVGSRWVTDSTAFVNGTRVALNAVNTVDDADVYLAPFDPGSTVSGSQEVVRREQSIALEFVELQHADTIEAYRTFSIDEDYSRYGRLTWYTASFDIPGYDPALDSLEYFVRFASDEKGNNYYEVRRRMPRASLPRATQWELMIIPLTDLSNLKLNPDFPKSGATNIVYSVPGSIPGETFVIRGRPSFTRVRRVSYGVINQTGRVIPGGQVWFDELRATEIARDAGRAQRVTVNGRMSNLFAYNFNWDGRDENFQSVGETRGSGSSVSRVNAGGTLDLHRFFEATGIVLPVTVNLNQNKTTPRFTAGDDVFRSGAAAELSETEFQTRSFSTSYSRAWSDRANPLLRYTLGGISASLGQNWTYGRSPTSVDTSRSLGAAVNYSISPRKLLVLPFPRWRFNLYPLPERFYWNYAINTSESRSYDRLRDSTGALVLRNDSEGRTAFIDFGADTRPIDMFHHQFSARRNLTLPENLREQWGMVNLGHVVNWRQAMDARYAVTRLGQWVKPTFSWNANYVQNNGPELSPDLSIRAISNGTSLTMNWDFPFDRLATRTPVTAVRDTVQRPVTRGPGVRRLLSRLGALSVDGSINRSSAYSRVSGTPDFMYLMGLSSDPDTAGSVDTRFGNRSDAATEWRTGARTRLDLGLGLLVATRVDFSNRRGTSNGVTNRSDRIRFPDVDFDYGKVVDLVGLKRLLVNPRLRTAYNRSQALEYSNSPDPTSLSTSSEWRPLIGLNGDFRNGARTELRVERRVTQTENRLLGNSVVTDRTTDVNFSVNRSYSQGQRVSFLGRESTVRSSVSLGLTAAYSRRSAETLQHGFDRPQNEISTDRLSVNTIGSYGFSTNLTGNLELGFTQTRDLQRDIVTRGIRVELRGQFTF